MREVIPEGCALYGVENDNSGTAQVDSHARLHHPRRRNRDGEYLKSELCDTSDWNTYTRPRAVRPFAMELVGFCVVSR